MRSGRSTDRRPGATTAGSSRPRGRRTGASSSSARSRRASSWTGPSTPSPRWPSRPARRRRAGSRCAWMPRWRRSPTRRCLPTCASTTTGATPSSGSARCSRGATITLACLLQRPVALALDPGGGGARIEWAEGARARRRDRPWHDRRRFPRGPGLVRRRGGPRHRRRRDAARAAGHRGPARARRRPHRGAWDDRGLRGGISPAPTRAARSSPRPTSHATRVAGTIAGGPSGAVAGSRSPPSGSSSGDSTPKAASLGRP